MWNEEKGQERIVAMTKGGTVLFPTILANEVPCTFSVYSIMYELGAVCRPLHFVTSFAEGNQAIRSFHTSKFFAARCKASSTEALSTHSGCVYSAGKIDWRAARCRRIPLDLAAIFRRFVTFTISVCKPERKVFSTHQFNGPHTT